MLVNKNQINLNLNLNFSKTPGVKDLTKFTTHRLGN